jgi:transcriptional regulator with XRE-family HTH domain
MPKTSPETTRSEFNVKFGQRLARLLEDRKMGHADLHRISKVERSTLTRIINGERRANNEHIAAIAAALNVEPGSLMPGSQEVQTAASLGMSDPDEKVDPTSPLGAYLERHADDLSRKDRRYLIAVANATRSTNEGTEADDDYFDGLLETLYELRRRRAARGRGGPRD